MTTLTPSKQLIRDLSAFLEKKSGRPVNIERMMPVYGGDINQSFHLKTSIGDLFVKINDADIYPGMFEKEARGLATIRLTGEIRVPEIIGTGYSGSTAFLVLEYIREGRKGPAFWEHFGRQLAAMHRHTWRQYGLDYDNYIGSLLQINRPDSSWVNFFIQNRLRYQLNLAANRGLADTALIKRFERLFDKLHDLFPVEFPHLLHGDLWSGNFLVDHTGEPVLIDPAIYYGHREMDLAMTRLFGGFDRRFYEAYDEAFPLQPGWEERLPVYQLYPLLVHLNLFGPSYLSSIRSVLDRYV